MSDLSPLSEEERKSNFGAAKSVDDAERTCIVLVADGVVRFNGP
jgi:hypothetical protein